jgi:hypothetical protein
MGLFDLFTGKKKDRIGYDAFALILYNNWYQSLQDDKIGLATDKSWFRENKNMQEWNNTLTETEKRMVQYVCHCLLLVITLAACKTFLSNEEKFSKARVPFLNLLGSEYEKLGLSSAYEIFIKVLDRNIAQYHTFLKALTTQGKFVDSTLYVLLKNICIHIGLPEGKLHPVVNTYISHIAMMNYEMQMELLGKAAKRFETVEDI